MKIGASLTGAFRPRHLEGSLLTAERRRRNGTLIALEPQVFDVLTHLIRHRDRVVTKDDLLGAVWQGRIVSESTLTSRINAARRAIGDTGEAQTFIRTVARNGIRFVGEVLEINGERDQLQVPQDRPSIGAVEPKLRKAETTRARRKRPESLEAYDLLLRALPFAATAMPEDAGKALGLLEGAIRLEPDYGFVNYRPLKVTASESS